MGTRRSKLAFLAASLLTLGGTAAHAAGFVSDFNSGLPPGTTLGGGAFVSPTNGLGNSGVLKLSTTTAAGTFIINSFTGGNSVTNFRVTYKFALGGGTCCGFRMADGLAFAFGNDIPASWTEDGAGTGLIVGFDTWDNGGTDTAPAIDVKVGGNADGNVAAFQSFTTLNGALREGGRAPAGPVLLDGAGQEVSIFTVDPAPAVPTDATFVDVYYELFSDNTFSLSYSNIVVFNRVPVTYTPVANPRFGWSARVGGANEHAWMDNLQVFANFTTGAVTIVTQPTNQTLTESQTATFAVVLDGTPPYSLQWFSNGVAIAGATDVTYTTPVATTNMNGTVYTVSASNALATAAVVSSPAVLTVNMGVVAQSASTGGRPNGVVVRFSKPVALSGTYTINNGVTVNSAAYGSTHSEVILTTTPLAAGASYLLTITGEVGEDTTPLIPNPTVLPFTQVGASCTDFATLPAGASLAGTARLADDGSGTNMVLHLTDDAQTGATGNYFLPAGSPSHFGALQASWKSRVGGELNVHADGYSFNWGSDLHSGTTGFTAEEGDGTGLSFTVDTWDNGSGPDNGIEIKYGGQRLAFKFIPRVDDGTGNFLTRDVFVNASASVDLAGNVTFNYDTNTISAVISNWNGIANGAVNFVARTGGEADNMWIDDFCVSNFTVGPLVFLRQPANAAVLEGVSAVFTAVVDGSPPHFFQWLTNGVPVAGATNATYTTVPTSAALEGLVVSVVVSNNFSSVTSTNAVLDVLRNPRIVSVVNQKNNEVRVYWSRSVDLDSGTYTFSGGIFEGSRSYGTNHSEVIITTDLLVPNTTYTLTIENVAEEGDPTNLQSPNPAVFTFRHGFGSVCADFETGAPAGAVLTGTANVTGGILHLTDAANDQNGSFFLPDQNAGFPVDRLAISFKTLIGPGSARIADGMSLNFGSDVASSLYGEEGGGTGLTVTFDTWDNNGTDTAPAIEVRYKGVTVATQAMAGIREAGRPASGPFINDAGGYPLSLDTSNQFANVRINVTPTGLLELYFKDVLVFQNVQLPNYTPFVGANLNLSARTGGANENAWIDDLCINNFSIGNVFFTQQPTNTDALEFLPATFTAAVDGTPPYYFQWYTNGVAVPGATRASFTTGPTRAVDDGMLISVSVSNQFNVVTSTNATLNVVTNPRVVSAFSQKENEVHVIFTRPVELTSGTYDLDNGGFEQERRYGTNHNEVVIITDAPLVANTTYTLTVTGVHEEGVPTNLLLPNPTVRTFRHGYGSACFDFTAMPPGASVLGSATVTGGALHVTDTVNSQAGTFFLPDQNGGFPMDRLLVTFKALIGSPTPGTRIADGLSFSVGSDFTSSTPVNLDGAGSGLVITFDTWDNATTDTAPAIEVRYKNVTVATQAMAGIREGGRAPAGPFLVDASGNPLSLDTSNQFVNVQVSVSPSGKLDMYFKGIPIFQNLQLPNYTPFVGANYAFGGNTGGANENAWIDDLCINPFSLGAVTITSQPTNTTVNEPSRVLLSVGVNGLPPYGVQWYSNNVAVAGATGLSYLTPLLNRAGNGAGYFAVVSNQFGSVTSQVATVTVVLDTAAPGLVWASADCQSSVYVKFSEALDPASAVVTANYRINNGITVNAATLLPNNLVRLSVSPNPMPGNTNILSVTGVVDRVGFNVVSNSIVISVKPPITATGPDNMLVFEAEDYDVNISPAPQTPSSTWIVSSSLPGASRGAYVEAAPNSGAGGGDTPNLFTNASQLQYCINVPTAGRYYLWARGSTANDGANNSFHFAIDGVSPDEFTRRVGNAVANWGTDPANVNAFGWVRDANGTGAVSLAQIQIATPGIHTFNVYMREDGIRLDTFILTTNSAYFLTPTEAGPSGIVRSGTGVVTPVALSIRQDTNGVVTITWPGTGWTLQATDRLNPSPGATVWQDQPFTSPVIIPQGFFGTGNTNVFFRLRR